MTENNLDVLKQIQANVKNLLLGNTQRLKFEEKFASLTKFMTKKKPEKIVYYYMQIKDFLYNYTFRKELNTLNDFNDIINYFNTLNNANSFPKLISVFGGSAAIKDRLTLSLYNLFDIINENTLSEQKLYFVNYPSINENLFRVAHLVKSIEIKENNGKPKKHELNLLFIPEIDWFPQNDEISKEDYLARLLIKTFNQFLLANSRLVIIIKSEGELIDNQQKLTELTTLYDMTSLQEDLENKVLFINCISNYYDETKQINITYQESEFPNFTLSLNESLELQSTNLLCVKEFALEKGLSNTEGQKHFGNLLLQHRNIIVPNQLKNPEEYGRLDFIRTNCLCNVYSNEHNEFVIIIETPGEKENYNCISEIHYVESYKCSFLLVYISFNKKYIISEKVKFKLEERYKNSGKIKDLFSRDIKQNKGLTIIEFKLK